MLSVDTWNANIKFDSQRVFITFHQEGNPSQVKRIPGRICLPVYLAVKQRQLGCKYKIRMMRKEAAEVYSHHIEESARQILASSDTMSLASGRSGRSNYSETPTMLQLPSPRLPKMAEHILAVGVSHVEDPGRFWCQRTDDNAKRDYKHILQIIGRDGSNVRPWSHRMPLRKGTLVIAPYAPPGDLVQYYRAKVLSDPRDDLPPQERR